MSKNSNGILKTSVVIAESFRNIHMTEDGILELLDNRIFLNLFENIPDFRQPAKVKYKLSHVLLIIFLTVLRRGKTSFLDIAYVIKANRKKYAAYGLLPDDVSTPSHDTIRRILTLLDTDELYQNTIQAFYFFLESLKKNYTKQGDYRHLCIDGKEMRASGRSNVSKSPRRNTAMLNVFDANTYTVLECVPIDEKENEIPVAQELLLKFNLRNTAVTADALHCQKKTASIIHNGRGIYVLTVKENQPLLLEEIGSRMNKHADKIKRYEDGTRSFKFLDLPGKYALADEWKGLKCFAIMHSDKCDRAFIANTKDHQLIMQAISLRWSIETFHKMKGADMNEDAVRSTDRQALRNIAMLNNLGEQLISLYQTISGLPHREAKVYFQENTIECLNSILSVMSSEEIINSLVKDLKKRRKSRSKN